MKILVTGERGQLGNELRRCFDTMQGRARPHSRRLQGCRGRLHRLPGARYQRCRCRRCLVCRARPLRPHHQLRGHHQRGRLRAKRGGSTARQCDWRREHGSSRQNCGGKIVSVSTDYVFPGTNPVPRVETDPIAPISAYGRTKWEGEVLTRAACERSFIVRTAWLYGYVGKNFVKTMLRLARENGKISVVNDNWAIPRAPTTSPTRFSRSPRRTTTARTIAPITARAAGSTSPAPSWIWRASSARRRG